MLVLKFEHYVLMAINALTGAKETHCSDIPAICAELKKMGMPDNTWMVRAACRRLQAAGRIARVEQYRIQSLEACVRVKWKRLRTYVIERVSDGKYLAGEGSWVNPVGTSGVRLFTSRAEAEITAIDLGLQVVR